MSPTMLLLLLQALTSINMFDRLVIIMNSGKQVRRRSSKCVDYHSERLRRMAAACLLPPAPGVDGATPYESLQFIVKPVRHIYYNS